MLTILAFGFGYLLALLSVRLFLPSVWKIRAVRRAFVVILVAGAVGWALRSIGVGSMRSAGPSQVSPLLAWIGATLLGASTVVSLALFLSAPGAAVLRLVARLLARIGARPVAAPVAAVSDVDAVDAPEAREVVPAKEPDVRPATVSIVDDGLDAGRRRFVTAATFALPSAALAAAGIGSASAFRAQAMPEREARVVGLPDGFDGLRVLQITDLHLGTYASVDDVEALMIRAEAMRPDLVVVTGDFSDHLPWVEPSLSLITQLRARLGVLAVLGNHEYYRGARENVRAYDKAGVDLLAGTSRAIRLGNDAIHVLGIDDPGRSKPPRYYASQADQALAQVPSGDFTLALCHRPEGFDALAERGVGLTLSGHTHGAQMGVGDHSLLESAMPDRYLRGFYRKADSVLYTSSGAGHWFPFRLNCPSEAPIVVLRAAPAQTA